MHVYRIGTGLNGELSMTDIPRKPLVWEIEQTHPKSVEPLKEALRTVVDPEIGLNIVELGLVRNVSIRNDQANVMMIMTTPFCPYAPALLEAARQKAEEALKIHTTVSFEMEPWDPSMMEEGAGAAWGFY
jgi:metal-sulfur cluster biosynthetic enzyme